ncbi:MAG: hypothetical protein U1F43_07685 [Myxococcota bacterium]
MTPTRSPLRALCATAALALACGACGSTSTGGRVTTDRDPDDGEGRIMLDDLSVGDLELGGFANADHAGTLLDIHGDHEVVKWMSCSALTFVAAGERLDVDATEHKVDPESLPGIMIIQHERISAILDDEQLTWLVERAGTRLELHVCDTPAVFTGGPLKVFLTFAATALEAHGGREQLPPLIPPSGGR